jgi:hypothetical protein
MWQLAQDIRRHRDHLAVAGMPVGDRWLVDRFLSDELTTRR